MGLSGSHVEFKEVEAAYREHVAAAGQRQRRALLGLCYDMICNPGAEHYTRHPGDLVSFNSRHPMVMAAAGALNPAVIEKGSPQGGQEMQQQMYPQIDAQMGAQIAPSVDQPPKLMTQQSRTLMGLIKRNQNSVKYMNQLDPASGEPMLYKCARSGFYLG